MKGLAQQYVDRLIDGSTGRFHFTWTSDGHSGLLYSEEYDDLSTTEYSADVYSRLDEGDCMMLFNVESREGLSLP